MILSESDEMRIMSGCWESYSSVPFTVTSVPPACGPNSGHTLLTTGPTACIANDAVSFVKVLFYCKESYE